MIGQEFVRLALSRTSRLQPDALVSLLHGRALSSVGWGVGDQALISLSNFVTMLLLARQLTEHAFGVFVLVYTGLLLGNNFQQALITQPHNVLGIKHKDDDYQTYTGTTLRAQVAYSLFVASLFVIAGLLSLAFAPSVTSLLFILAAAAPAWQLQDFFRRVMYTEARPRDAFRNDVISYAGQAFLIAVLFAANGLSPESALVALAVTSFAAAIVGFWQVRDSLSWQFDMAYIRENWLFSRWLVGGTASYWLSTQSYQYMVALLIGPAATAVIAAVHILLRPIGVVNLYLETNLPSYFTRKFTSVERHKLRREFFLPIMFTIGPVLLYIVGLLIFGEYVLEIAFDDKYRDQRLLITLVSAYYLLIYFGQFLASALRALQATETLFIASLSSAVITLTVGWLLIEMVGVEGAVLGSIANSLVFTVLVSRRVRKELARRGYWEYKV